MAILLLAALIVVGLDRALATQTESVEELSYANRLFVQPTDNGVYLLGNSMFKTGIDVERLAAGLPDRTPVDFEYHNGHYTNLWYLIARTAMGRTTEDPAVVVWGFRPAFAMDPALRQARLNETDLFAFEDPIYDALRVGTEFAEPPTFSSANVRDQLEASSGLYRKRSDVASFVSDRSVELGIDALDRLGVEFASSLRESIVEGDRSLADEITRLVTDGEVQLTEELVDDTQGDFITGPKRDFDEGYLPHITAELERQGLEQIVIIWRPVIAANGAPDPAEDEFVERALEFFEDNGIPVIDLYHDDDIGPSDYGDGDHYNETGRRIVTDKVARFLADYLASSE